MSPGNWVLRSGSCMVLASREYAVWYGGKKPEARNIMVVWPHSCITPCILPSAQKCFSDGLEWSQHLKIFALDGYISYYLKMERFYNPINLRRIWFEPLDRQLDLSSIWRIFASAESKTSLAHGYFWFFEAENSWWVRMVGLSTEND